MGTNSTIFVERRKHKRILTIKNSIRAAAAVLVLFTAVSVASEFRDKEPGKLGSLYQKRPVVAELEPPKPKVIVTEGAGVADQDLADPLTAEAMRREKILGVAGPDPLDPRNGVQISSTAEYFTPDYRPSEPLDLKAESRGKARFSIEGGAGGVYTRYGD